MRRGGAPSAGVVLSRGWWATGQIGEVATLNSSWELTVGSSSKEKPMVTRALTVARYNTNSKTSSSLAPLGERGDRKAVGEGVRRKMRVKIHACIWRRSPKGIRLSCGGAARTRAAGKAAEPALSKAKGPECGPCATCPWTAMSARPSVVGGRLAAPSVYIAAEPRSVGAPLVGSLKSAMPTGRAGTRPAPTR